ncbi:MAG: AAA family ATPase [Mycobacterium kyogaense]|uniref:AAA family ATPase n=1 Tax=Mycobacterium kyogaense TaxID=2212479 RepID=UPI002FFCAC1F
MWGLVERPAVERITADFLAAAADRPAMLVIEGEPGIGKTTAWREIIDRAQRSGFRVLRTRPSAAETGVAYAGLGDLLDGVDAQLLDILAPPQRAALDHVLLRGGADAEPVSARAVASATLALLAALTRQAPVLLAVDDAQWLDSSTRFVLGFVLRRLDLSIGALATVRSGHRNTPATAWLCDAAPAWSTNMSLPHFTVDDVDVLIGSALHRRVPRRTLNRIHELSGGNPFYALEFSRTLTDDGELRVPASLVDLVGTRVAILDDEVRRALLVVAATTGATVELVAEAVDVPTSHAAALLEEAESQDIVTLSGHRVRFVHPLLAHAVYTGAAPADRRTIHRRLAESVPESESRARHLALGSIVGDAATTRALSDAADIALSRGAPAAAAELLDLAESLGDDDPALRIRSATAHFDAGDAARAESVLQGVLDTAKSGPERAGAAMVLARIRIYGNGFSDARDVLVRFEPEAADNPELSVRMRVLLAYCLYNTGRMRDAQDCARAAADEAQLLESPGLLAEALGMQMMIDFVCGLGVDLAVLREVATTESVDGRSIPLAFRPSALLAVAESWTGNLDEAFARFQRIRQRCRDLGEEGEVCYIDFHLALLETWRGNHEATADICAELAAGAQHLDDGYIAFNSLVVGAYHAAHTGDVDTCRAIATKAYAIGRRVGAIRMSQLALDSLGFVEVALGDYAAALRTLAPSVEHLHNAPEFTEIVVACGVPDAIEAMVGLGRTAEATELVDMMERNGRRLDRAWMLVVALRGRALVLAAAGDLHGAEVALADAMVQHDRLPMPFERARTLFARGQIHRRRRRRALAQHDFGEAVRIFETVGSPLWASRARAELTAGPALSTHGNLTGAEHRVAELAATGITQRAIADALFVSPKTVDSHLRSIYRKLGVHSRGELVHRLSRPGPPGAPSQQ